MSVAVAAVLSACSSTPERIEALETARAIVPQVESSPRAGVAPLNLANARKSLDEADRLAESRAKLADIEFHAQNAVTHAQIAQQKIATVEAREQIAQATEEQQVVLLAARERDAQASTKQASDSQQRIDSLEQKLADLNLQKTERGLVLTLGDVLFDTGQATLKAGAYGTLDRLAAALRDEAGRTVMIEGHTDDVGSDEMNQGLSLRRAQSVESALIQRGVAQQQINALGRGESSPVATNEDPAGRQQNRRVEIIFTEGPTRIADDR